MNVVDRKVSGRTRALAVAISDSRCRASREPVGQGGERHRDQNGAGDHGGDASRAARKAGAGNRADPDDDTRLDHRSGQQPATPSPLG
jgi:hypothetical protein